jgi:ribonuclease BN (tRNA processing enzyme)
MTKNEVYTIENSETIFNINKKGWYLKGWSRAGLKTGFILYPFKILFDCGIYTPSKPDIIFLTHQHVDHTQAIAHICSRHKPIISTIYLPTYSIKALTKYERAISELSNIEAEKLTDDEILKDQNIKFIGVEPSDKIELIVSNQELEIEVLKAYHDVPSNGYGFSSWKKQIKPEYEYLIKELNEDEKIQLNQEEQKQLKQDKIKKIKELKLLKIEMYNLILNPEFVFYCDSTIENLLSNNEWKKYPVVICECTGLDVCKLDNTNRNYDDNHTSLATLKPIMLENKDKKWFIIHVSLGCSEDLIKQIELDLISEGLDVKICI